MNKLTYGNLLIFILLGYAVCVSFSADLTCSKKKYLDENSVEHYTEECPAKIILDTDGGVDDVTALLVLLSDAHDPVDLLAITTTGGDTDVENATRNILKGLDMLGKLDKVPVYMGSGAKLSNDTNYTQDENFFGVNGFGDADIERPPISKASEGLAPLKIIELVKKYPKEVTIIAIAPLTNIAIAIKLYPSLLDEIKELYILGFAEDLIPYRTTGRQNEFNAIYDAVAGQIVFQNIRENSETYLLLADVFGKADIDVEWRTDVLGAVDSPKIRLLNKASEHNLNLGFKKWVDADSFLVAVYLNKDMVKSVEKYRIEILTCPPEEIATCVLKDDHPTVSVYRKVDVELYKEALLKYLK